MLILVTGGAASGKSEFAEQLLGKWGNKKYYIATMHVDQHKETMDRIMRHRILRKDKGFVTIEKETDIAGVLKMPEFEEKSCVIMECMSNLLANEMYIAKRADVVDGICHDLLEVAGHCECLVVVTGEVGSDGQSYDEFTENFIRNLALINKKLAANAKEVYEVLYSIPIRLK